MKRGIYKITNPEGEVYIGQSKNIEKRWKHYTTNPSKNQPKLFYSFLKYGWINHKFEIIEECNNLIERERYWISYYKSENNGLNGDKKVVLNGDIGRKAGFTFQYPEEAKKIKSIKMKKLWEEGNFQRQWARKCQHIPSGKIYNSLKEAELDLKVSSTKLRKMLEESKIVSYIV